MKKQLLLISILLVSFSSAFATSEEIKVSVTCIVSEFSPGMETEEAKDTKLFETKNTEDIIDVVEYKGKPVTVKVETYLPGFNDPVTSKITSICLNGACAEGGADLISKTECGMYGLRVSCHRN